MPKHSDHDREVRRDGGEADEHDRRRERTRRELHDARRVLAEHRLAPLAEERERDDRDGRRGTAVNRPRAPGPRFHRSSRKKARNVWYGIRKTPNADFDGEEPADRRDQHQPADDLEEAERDVGFVEAGVGELRRRRSPCSRTGRADLLGVPAAEAGVAEADRRERRGERDQPERDEHAPPGEAERRREQRDEQRREDVAEAVRPRRSSSARGPGPAAGTRRAAAGRAGPTRSPS